MNEIIAICVNCKSKIRGYGEINGYGGFYYHPSLSEACWKAQPIKGLFVPCKELEHHVSWIRSRDRQIDPRCNLSQTIVQK